MSKFFVLPAAFLALFLPASVSAHHGWGEYDADRTVTVTTTLNDVEWTNPHSRAKIDHDGRTWELVLGNTQRMTSRGLTPAMLASGVEATVEGYPRADGTPTMRIERITLAGVTVELR